MLRNLMIAGVIAIAIPVLAQDHSNHSGHADHSDHSEHLAPSSQTDHSGHAGHTSPGATVADSEVVAAFMAANDKMHADMSIEYTGDVDVDFLRGMIPHHQGAIDMALVALEYSENEQIRALAEEIIAVQQGEIDQMRAWLAEMGY